MSSPSSISSSLAFIFSDADSVVSKNMATVPSVICMISEIWAPLSKITSPARNVCRQTQPTSSFQSLWVSRCCAALERCFAEASTRRCRSMSWSSEMKSSSFFLIACQSLLIFWLHVVQSFLVSKLNCRIRSVRSGVLHVAVRCLKALRSSSSTPSLSFSAISKRVSPSCDTLLILMKSTLRVNTLLKIASLAVNLISRVLG
mmetsp:Transcript_3532/g.6114  ORF Transcript_3532/g.6114 Transcript_3532/m.6114 type:complete len:202 (-) Transcript_3532:1092-1697(-)